MGVLSENSKKYNNDINAAKDNVDCHCPVHSFLNPLKNKMKRLKNIKKHIGLASTGKPSNSYCDEILPPLKFSTITGSNVTLQHGNSVAVRHDSFCKGITFTDRPVKMGEKVRVRLLDVASNWSGIIRFGFTNRNPHSWTTTSLPKYACPDLTNKNGYWAKAVSERYGEQGTVLHFYYNMSGEVHFGVNGVDKNIFLTGVEPCNQLWAIIDIYGNSTAVELVRANENLNNNAIKIEKKMDDSKKLLEYKEKSSPSTCSYCETISKLARFDTHKFNPLQFNTNLMGSNISIICDGFLATRNPKHSNNAYVFFDRPIALHELVALKIRNCDKKYTTDLTVGVTTCPPNSISSNELPNNSDHLMDREEYWVVSKSAINSTKEGDIVSFWISCKGELKYRKNDEAPKTLMFVDQTQVLWLFFDLGGKTTEITAFTNSTVNYEQCEESCNTITRYSYSSPERAAGAPISPQKRLSYGNRSSYVPDTLLQPATSSKEGQVYKDSMDLRLKPMPTKIPLKFGNVGTMSNSETCNICFDCPIDTVLYKCGHMCMCFNCAQQWRLRQGHCPVCRSVVTDVIKAYKT